MTDDRLTDSPGAMRTTGISVVVDTEAAEAVSELFNRYNGGDYDEDNEAGEAGGGGAVIEATGFELVEDYELDDAFAQAHKLVVKTYIKPGQRGQEVRRRIEEGLWRLSLLYPIPEAQIRPVRVEDWANAWKQFYKPLRVGHQVVLKPSWEEFQAEPDDIVIELDPGMAFGTGLHPSTRLCMAALEQLVRPATPCWMSVPAAVCSPSSRESWAPVRCWPRTSIPLAVRVAAENAARNGIDVGPQHRFVIEQESVPVYEEGVYDIVVANILAEVLAKLFDGAYGNPPLAQPLKAGGHMILAGIIEERADLVIAAAQRHGLTLVDRRQEGDLGRARRHQVIPTMHRFFLTNQRLAVGVPRRFGRHRPPVAACAAPARGRCDSAPRWPGLRLYNRD